jgi:hypothetical protein
MATTIAPNRSRLREIGRRAGHAAPQLVIDFILSSLGCAPQRLYPGLLGDSLRLRAAAILPLLSKGSEYTHSRAHRLIGNLLMGTLIPTKQSKRMSQQNKIESLVFFMLMVLTMTILISIVS